MNTVDTTTQAPSAAKAAAHFLFGTLAPIERVVEWGGGLRNTVSYHLLSAGEEQRVTRYGRVVAEGATTSQEYLMAVTIARLAYSLRVVDGKVVAKECPTIDDRLEMVGELGSPLLDALISEYGDAREEPLQLLSEMLEDAPDFEQPASGNGLSSETLAYGMDES